MPLQKPRASRSFEDAIARIAGELTFDTAAAAIGKSSSLLRQASDPDTNYSLAICYGPPLDILYSSETGEAPPIYSAYGHQLGNLVQPRVTTCDPTQLLGEIAKECGEAMAAFADSASKGRKLSEREMMEALREVHEAQDKLRQAERHVLHMGGAGPRPMPPAVVVNDD